MGATKDKIKQIYDTLPQLNCGLCGFDSCGQFARAVAEGRASLFGCRQNPWAGYQISHIIGSGAAVPRREGFYRPTFRSRPASSPSLDALAAEVRELSMRLERVFDRIEKLRMRQ
jgi:Na+-translocating ferredoxin:NAD+ oxidoreductase RNF subunit RnfB